MPDQPAAAFDDTIIHPGAPLDSGTLPTPEAGPRTTVLPKIQFNGDRPQLAHSHQTRYEIVSALGEGGQGEILNAIDHDIGRMVALKRLRGPNALAPETVLRFIEEIRTTGRLEHPNIVPVHDVGVDEQGHYYFIMKRIEGETLESIIGKLAAGDPVYHQRFGFERRMAIFRDLVEALAYAHTQGYIHRDIKPANVMVGAFGETILMDWGIAKRLDDSQTFLDQAISADLDDDRVLTTQTGVVVGTPAYMSPEQALGQPVDARADVYSLCVLLHEFMTLDHYLADRTTVMSTLMGVTTVPVPPAYHTSSPHQGKVPPDIGWLITDGVNKDVEARYASLQAIEDRLDQRDEGEILVQCPLTAAKRMTRRAGRLIDNHPLLSGGAFVSLVGFSLFGLVSAVRMAVGL